MSVSLIAEAGSALVWRSVQLAGVKLIFLLRTVVLVRLLAPEDFGLFAISIVAVDLLLNVTNFGLIPALVQRGGSDDRQCDAAWTIGMIRAVAIAIAAILAAPWIAQLFGEPRATSLIQVVALRPILDAAVSIRVAEMTRSLRFRGLAFIHLPEAFANAFVSIALAPFFGVWALAAGTLAGAFVAMFASYALAPHRMRLLWDPRAARPLMSFGGWIFLTSLLAVIGSSVLQLVIARKLGSAALGVYFIASKFAFIPAEISAEVVGAVAFPLYSRLRENAQKLAAGFRAILVGVAAVLTPACALLAALAPSLVENVLGPRWEGAGSVIQVLALVSVVGFFGDMAVPVLKGLGSPRSVFAIEFVQASLLIALIWILADAFGIVGAALAWLPAVAAAQFLSAILLSRLAPRVFSGVGRPLSAIAAVSFAGAGAAWMIDAAVPGLSGLALGAGIGVAVIGSLLWLSDRRWNLGISANASRVFPRLAGRFGAAVAEK